MRTGYGGRAGHVAFAFALALGLAMSASCMSQHPSHTVGGKNAAEVFGGGPLAGLAAAACVGDATRIEYWIDNGADPNGVGYNGATPLSWAISCRNAVGVEELLVAGADPNKPVGGNFTPVFQAAGYVDNPEILAIIIQHDGDPDGLVEGSIQGALGESLEYGSLEGKWDNWRLLLENGASVKGEVGRDLIASSIRLEQYGITSDILYHGYDGDLKEVESLLKNFPYTGNNPSVRREWASLVERLASEGSPSI